MTTNTTIAATILAQLGGNKFRAMTGAKNLVALERGGLQFDLPRGATTNKATKVQIVLAGNDTYTLAFYKVRGINCDKIGQDVHGLYCDQLRGAFEGATGLATRL
eukprot:gene20756-21457_t